MHAPLLTALPIDPPPGPASPSAPAGTDTRMGALLVELGRLAPADIERVVRAHTELGVRFGECAMRLGLVSQADVDAALARQFTHPVALHGDSLLSPDLLAAWAPGGAPADALRAVRSALQQRWFSQGERALAVASAAAAMPARRGPFSLRGMAQGSAGARGQGGSLRQDAGGSVFCANLALVFAQLGQRTVLVDAQLRHGAQHALFGLRGGRGLSDVLAGRAGLDVVAPVAGFPTLSVLAAGTVPPNPQELLERAAFGAMHAELVRRYDVVLYDVAPGAHGADALAVARCARGALLLAYRGRTPLPAVRALAQQLDEAGAAVVGSVLVED